MVSSILYVPPPHERSCTMTLFRCWRDGADTPSSSFFLFVATRVHSLVNPPPEKSAPEETVHAHGRRWVTIMAIGGSSVLAFPARNCP
ncbi:hypothetical protein L195_g042533 [Trifolium pratense]|uniref:Uncharacterized protein n=1 Tax=Trifolium pratense TaxID=57577 RepID=A0A2K3M6Q4_TRIPR|nr:hypothetical protein L195_g042533 [Trifolium pratense]